ncbi:unnamed protein product [Moneuplotes crassus]|uniref:Uncharacterized protein n=1 Tax=Euplotes crassus TaxID=5936 RepID=A0AAD1Y555_EUPCR|nr:unnamed protein product [Moneuplotes crassus]
MGNLLFEKCRFHFSNPARSTAKNFRSNLGIRRLKLGIFHLRSCMETQETDRRKISRLGSGFSLKTHEQDFELGGLPSRSDSQLRTLLNTAWAPLSSLYLAKEQDIHT